MFAANFDFGTELHWTTDGVLSASECDDLISSLDDADWLASTVNTAEGRQVDDRVRNNQLAMLDDAARWHALIEERLRPTLPAVMFERPLVGIGPKLRVYRYREGDHFGVHSDQFYVGNWDGIDVISRLTLLLYLNEGFEGGQTRFFEPEQQDVEPRTGTVLLFQHALEHQGVRVDSGEKLVLRTDVFYRA